MTDCQHALADCLKREREALLAGDFRGLAALEAEKSDLIARLDGPVAGELEMALRRNLELFAAAAEGLGQARVRIVELRRLAEGQTTYAADGRREPRAKQETVARRV